MQVGTYCNDDSIFHQHVGGKLSICIHNHATVNEYRGAHRRSQLLENRRVGRVGGHSELVVAAADACECAQRSKQ